MSDPKDRSARFVTAQAWSGELRYPEADSALSSPAHADEEALLAVALSSARVGLWSWDSGSDSVWYSDELYRLHGVRPGTLGTRLDDYVAFIHPEDRERVTKDAWAAATGETVPTEYRFVHPEGGIRHLVGRAALVRDRSGDARRLVGTIQDVTEVARARRSLSETFTRLSSYFEEMPTPAYLWRREGEEIALQRLNRAARSLWGERADGLVGSYASVLLVDRPDALADLGRCLQSQVAFTSEMDFDSHDRGTRRLIVTYVPLAPDTLVAYSEDISELLEAHEREQRAAARLAEYFQRVPTPAFLWREVDGEIVLQETNHAGLEQTDGIVKEFIGITAREMYVERPDVLTDLRRALAGETFKREMRYRLLTTHKERDLVVTYVHIPPDTVVAHTRDVTEQRLMEAELRTSHESARGILDACGQPIFLCDVDGTVLTMNLAVGESFGVQESDVLGRSFSDFLPSEAALGLRQAVEQVVEGRNPVTLEDERHGRTFRSRVYPLLDDSGAVTRVVVYAEDVTEERQARDELLLSRERHETAQRIGHLGHWDWDVERGKLFWSPEVYRIFGVDAEDDVSFETFVQAVHAEDRDRVQSSVERALSHGGPYSFEHRVLRPDGSTRIVLEQGEVIREGGLPRMMVGTVLDITELKKAEQTVRDRESEMTTVMEGNPDGICLIVEGCISACNGSLSSLVGYAKEQLIGRALHDIMIPADKERAQERGRAILEGGRSEPSEYTLVRGDGSQVSVEIFSAAFQFRGESALICMLRDIEGRKESERELARSRDVLRALTQHLESVRESERVQVARDLHDELGSILTALKIDVAELHASDADAELIDAMSDLLDQAIEVGRRVTARLRPGVLDDLGLAAAAEWLGADLEKRTGVRCKVVLPEVEPQLSEPVATAMFRILQEALTNVIRHAEAERVTIELAADQATVSLTVTDDGAGFDPGPLGRTGFGLLGMRERVRALEGTFDLSSAPSEGTRIRVTLPLTTL